MLALRIRIKIRHFFRDTPNLWVFLKFGLLTWGSTMIGVAFYYILLALGVDHSIAYICQYATGTTLLFILKFILSEGVSRRSIVPRAIAFIALYATTMFIGERLLVLFTELLHVPAGWALWLTYPFTFTLNTLGSRFFIFRDADNNEVRAIKDQKKKEQSDGGDNSDGGQKDGAENDSDQ